MWQPIETAPKDGTICILCVYEFNNPENKLLTVIGKFRDGKWREELTEEQEWDDGELHPPTHWMPLPAPPVKEYLTTDYAADTSQNTEWE